MQDLVRQTLRMRPDRIVVGEVRGAEVVDLLTAFNTGHDGRLPALSMRTPPLTSSLASKRWQPSEGCNARPCIDSLQRRSMRSCIWSGPRSADDSCPRSPPYVDAPDALRVEPDWP